MTRWFALKVPVVTTLLAATLSAVVAYGLAPHDRKPQTIELVGVAVVCNDSAVVKAHVGGLGGRRVEVLAPLRGQGSQLLPIAQTPVVGRRVAHQEYIGDDAGLEFELNLKWLGDRPIRVEVRDGERTLDSADLTPKLACKDGT